MLGQHIVLGDLATCAASDQPLFVWIQTTQKFLHLPVVHPFAAYFLTMIKS